MISPSDISLIEVEGADVDGADQDEVEWEEGVVNPDCHDLNCASLHLTVAASMAHI